MTSSLHPPNGSPPPQAGVATTSTPNWTPNQQAYYGAYSIPSTPNNRHDHAFDTYTTPGSHASSMLTSAPSPSPPTTTWSSGHGYLISPSSSAASMGPSHSDSHLGMPSLEGSSASMRLFPPTTTVFTPTQLYHLSAQHQHQHQHQPTGTPGGVVHYATPSRTSMPTVTNGIAHPIAANSHSQHLYQHQYQHHHPQQQTHPASNMHLTTTGASRKRSRMNEGDSVGSDESPNNSNNLVPPILLGHLIAASTSGDSPPPIPLSIHSSSPSSSPSPSSSQSLHIHTSLESIQASLDSLQAVQVSQAQAQAVANMQQQIQGATPIPTPVAETTPTPTQTTRKTNKDSSNTSTKRASGANGTGGGGKRTKTAAASVAPTPVDIMPSANISIQSTMSQPSFVAPIENEPDDEDDRKTKHRLIEKQRRDELKKNMETLSGLINYQHSTNKNGVVCSAIAYLNAQRAELVVERERSKAFQEQVELLEKQVRDLKEANDILQQAHSDASGANSTVSTDPNSLALIPQYDSKFSAVDPVPFKQYQLLFMQHQELRHLYAEATKGIVHGSVGVGGSIPHSFMPKKLQLLSAPLSPTFSVPRAGSPYLSYHGDIADETTQSSVSSSPIFDLFGSNSPSRRPSLDPSMTHDMHMTNFSASGSSFSANPSLQVHLSTTLKAALHPSPVDYRATFKTDGTSRVLANRDNIIIDATERFCLDVGYSYAELIGMHMNDLTPTVKQPMCQLVASRSVHGCEAVGILNCHKTKRGGVVFRYGIVEVIWETPRCTGGTSRCEVPPPTSGNVYAGPNFGANFPASSVSEVTTPESNSSNTSPNNSSNDATPTASVNSSSDAPSAFSSSSSSSSIATADREPTPPTNPSASSSNGSANSCSHESNDKFFFPTVPPCRLCGTKVKYTSFVGFPTHYTDIDHYLMLSVRAAISIYDSSINMLGLDLDEFYSKGKIAYEVPPSTTPGHGHGGTTKSTKLLPMRFVQAVQIYDQLARLASATKSNPPRIEL